MEDNCFTSTLSGEAEYEIRYDSKSGKYVLYIDDQIKLSGTMDKIADYLNKLGKEI